MNKEIELHIIATYQGKEYELENLLNGLLNKLEEKDNEIERLNNIIDELEKWLKEQYEFIDTISEFPTIKEIQQEYLIMLNDYENVLNKLKELKEGK